MSATVFWLFEVVQRGATCGVCPDKIRLVSLSGRGVEAEMVGGVELESDVPGSLECILSQLPAGVFGGVFRDGGVVVVAVSGGLADRVAAQVAEQAPEIEARVVPVRRCYAELVAISGRLRDRCRFLESVEAGFEVVQWGPDPRTNTVEVGVRGDLGRARRALEVDGFDLSSMTVFAARGGWRRGPRGHQRTVESEGGDESG